MTISAQMRGQVRLKIDELKEQFAQRAEEERAIKMKDYLKGQFDFYGVMAGPRKDLSKAFIAEVKQWDWDDLRTVCENLWSADQRELHYVAIDLLTKVKKVPEESLSFFEYLIVTKSWWDTVDGVASTLVGNYFIRFPEQRVHFVQKWLESDNRWLIRTAIIHQLKYKSHVDWPLLKHCIESSLGTKEFFIDKAHGWALREYSKVEPERVEEYILNCKGLSGLAVREGLRVIKQKRDS